MNSPDPLVGITMGDPSGIGPEVIATGHASVVRDARPVVIGDAGVLRMACAVAGTDLDVRSVDHPAEATSDPTVLSVLDLANVEDHTWGIVDRAYGRASLDYVEHAIDLAIDGTIDAIVTAPINKQSTRLAGAEHAGHTGLLAERTDTADFAMMLIEEDLRVTHVSTHVPLREACDLVTEARVLTTIEVTADGLRDLGVEQPRIAVAGLNHHAGDGGVLGNEDEAVIAPAIEAARGAGIDTIGPEPPDTVFARAATGAFDGVVAMYHDQGHIPIKLLGFSDEKTVSGVNVTIGLPIVRTSVDHGTAFDIAGAGVASAASLISAVAVATDIVTARHESGL